MAPFRSLSVLALAAAFAVFVAPARGDILLPGFPPICLPPGLPLLQCPAAAQTGGEPKPAVVTPTTVRYDPRRIIVSFRRRTRSSVIDAAFTHAGVRLERRLTKIGLYVVKAPEGKRDRGLASLRREKSVDYIQREQLVDGPETPANDPQ